MNKVYVVQSIYHGDGYTQEVILGIYASADTAEEVVQNLRQHKEPRHDFFWCEHDVIN